MRMDDDQMARIYSENAAMLERLNGVYARQQATLRALVEPQSMERLTAHVRCRPCSLPYATLLSLTLISVTLINNDTMSSCLIALVHAQLPAKHNPFYY